MLFTDPVQLVTQKFGGRVQASRPNSSPEQKSRTFAQISHGIHSRALGTYCLKPIFTLGCAGHYVALVKSQGVWLLYEDDRVEVVGTNTVQSVFGSTQAGHSFLLPYTDPVDASYTPMVIRPTLRNVMETDLGVGHLPTLQSDMQKYTFKMICTPGQKLETARIAVCTRTG